MMYILCPISPWSKVYAMQVEKIEEAWDVLYM
jgi:hypothetical protein